MGDWKTTTLGDVASFQRGHDLPDTIRIPGNVPVMGSFGITGWHDKSRAKGPGVTIGRSGASIGVVSFIDCDYWPLNTCLFVTNFHGNNPKFVYYLLKTIDLAAHNSGSAQPSLNRNYIYPLPVSIPERREQDSIATLLEAFDKKIAQNERINETLEAMTRAIFKDWFVDFGPTRMKLDGGIPYLRPEIWALFPDRLNDEGNPEGWKQLPLRQLGDTSIGGYWGDDSPQGTDAIQFVCLRGVDLENLRSTGACLNAPIRWGKSSAIEKRPITECDVLVAGSGAGPCGRSLWLSRHVDSIGALPVTYSNFVKRISCSSPAAACFLDRILHEMRLSGEIWSYVNGTSVPNLNDRGLLDGKIIAIPSDPVLNAFCDLVRVITAKLFQEESRTLAATRDLLLLKLISGEIRIREAEKLVEKVA